MEYNGTATDLKSSIETNLNVAIAELVDSIRTLTHRPAHSWDDTTILRSRTESLKTLVETARLMGSL